MLNSKAALLGIRRGGNFRSADVYALYDAYAQYGTTAPFLMFDSQSEWTLDWDEVHELKYALDRWLLLNADKNRISV